MNVLLLFLNVIVTLVHELPLQFQVMQMQILLCSQALFLRVMVPTHRFLHLCQNFHSFSFFGFFLKHVLLVESPISLDTRRMNE